jgi:hypothetical protein
MTTRTIGTVLVAILLLGATAHAGLIDFEDAMSHYPGGADNRDVSTQYLASDGVSFSILAGATAQEAAAALPTYEAWGDADPIRGFLFDQGHAYDVEDVAVAGYEDRLGDWFLKGPAGVADTGYLKLVIDYAAPVTGAGGELWDIDGNSSQGTEQWLVSARDGDGVLLASILSPEGTTNTAGSLDALPWAFSFAGLEAGIEQITIEFVGTKTYGVGIAFDNFYTDTPGDVPEPAAMALLALGGAALAARRRFA